jgi:hypothetical protein
MPTSKLFSAPSMPVFDYESISRDNNLTEAITSNILLRTGTLFRFSKVCCAIELLKFTNPKLFSKHEYALAILHDLSVSVTELGPRISKVKGIEKKGLILNEKMCKIEKALRFLKMSGRNPTGILKRCADVEVGGVAVRELRKEMVDGLKVLIEATKNFGKAADVFARIEDMLRLNVEEQGTMEKTLKSVWARMFRRKSA